MMDGFFPKSTKPTKEMQTLVWKNRDNALSNPIVIFRINNDEYPIMIEKCNHEGKFYLCVKLQGLQSDPKLRYIDRVKYRVISSGNAKKSQMKQKYDLKNSNPGKEFKAHPFLWSEIKGTEIRMQAILVYHKKKP